jgi:hypothetical protein
VSKSEGCVAIRKIGRASSLDKKDCSHRERIELFSSGCSDALVAHLPFADHMHHFNAGQDDARTGILEFPHRFDDALDGPVVLLDDVVLVFVLADLGDTAVDCA